MTPQNITLVDDGTLDVVAECDCPECGEHLKYRFQAEFVAMFDNGLEGAVVDAWQTSDCAYH